MQLTLSILDIVCFFIEGEMSNSFAKQDFLGTFVIFA